MKRVLWCVAAIAGCAFSDRAIEYEAASGNYGVVGSFADVHDSCFPPELRIPVPARFHLSVDSPLVELSWFADEPLPEVLVGGVSGEDVRMVSARTLLVTTACTLAFEMSFDAIGLSSTAIGVDVTVYFSADHSVVGDQSGCDDLAGQTFHGLPFPILEDANRSCTAIMRGVAERDVGGF